MCVASLVKSLCHTGSVLGAYHVGQSFQGSGSHLGIVVFSKCKNLVGHALYMSVAGQSEQSLLLFGSLSGCKCCAHLLVDIAIEGSESLLCHVIVFCSYLSQQDVGSIITAYATQSLDGSGGSCTTFLDGLYHQRFLTGDSVLAQPVEDVHTSFFLA